jgi:hypothetical protein
LLAPKVIKIDLFTLSSSKNKILPIQKGYILPFGQEVEDPPPFRQTWSDPLNPSPPVSTYGWVGGVTQAALGPPVVIQTRVQLCVFE